MPDELTTPKDPAQCSYCGAPLDSRIYFCPSCTRPHRSVEQMLPSSLPEYEDIDAF